LNEIEVYEAYSGKKAIEIFLSKVETNEEIFDYIFMDINMPEMSGIQCIKNL
jgi:YesN/AraC family two-component response regulator